MIKGCNLVGICGMNCYKQFLKFKSFHEVFKLFVLEYLFLFLFFIKQSYF